MNVGLLVDATCDLPQSLFDRYQIHILPTSVTLKKSQITDNRQQVAATDFYESNSSSKVNSAKAYSPSKQSVHDLITKDLIYRYDNLLIIAPHLKLSDSLQTLREETFNHQPEFEKLRQAAHLNNAFRIRIIEADTSFTGYGLVVYEALRLMHEKARSVDQLKAPLDQFKRKIVCYVLPGQHNYQQYSEHPFNQNWLEIQKLKFGKITPVFQTDNQGLSLLENLPNESIENNFFTVIHQKIGKTELHNHLVNISYAGKLARLRVLPQFKALHEHVKSRGGKLVYSMMSITSAAQLGAGAISVSFSQK